MALEHPSNSKAAPPPKHPAPPASDENRRRKRSRRSPESPSDDLLASILVTLAQGGESSNATAAVQRRHLHECDVCFKTFRSHQALGGHKASHRKSASVAAAGAEYGVRPSAAAVKSYPASDICRSLYWKYSN